MKTKLEFFFISPADLGEEKKKTVKHFLQFGPPSCMQAWIYGSANDNSHSSVSLFWLAKAVTHRARVGGARARRKNSASSPTRVPSNLPDMVLPYLKSLRARRRIQWFYNYIIYKRNKLYTMLSILAAIFIYSFNTINQSLHYTKNRQ